MDVRTARLVDKRRITGSRLLARSRLSLVFQRERERTNTLGETEHETVDGSTRWPASVGTTWLQVLVREPWGRDHGRHARRDRRRREDDSQRRMGHAPHVLAILNHTALGLFARQGETPLPHAQRTFASHFDRALAPWQREEDVATALPSQQRDIDGD